MLIYMILTITLVGVASFHLSMSSIERRKPLPGIPPFGPPLISRPFTSPLPMPSESSVTSGIVSQLAVVALKLRLKEQKSVTCEASASTMDLLKGSTGAVVVKGRGWKSELGLTCRAIEATVDNCEIDVSQILSRQKIVLRRAAHGTAKIALNADDFANFITHPLMQPPLIEGSSGEDKLRFLKEHVSIDSLAQTVCFSVAYRGKTYSCELSRGANNINGRAQINVMPPTGLPDEEHVSNSKIIADSLSSFFNKMVFELDGTFLTFRDMMVTKKGIPSMLLSLNIKVEKLPSRSLAF